MKKVIIGGFHHESDTFNPIITGRDDIKVSRGEELLAKYNGGENALSGIVEAIRGKVEIIPTVFARAVPGGVWDKEYYLALKEELLSTCKSSYPFDAITLALHGSMAVDEIGDAETDLLKTLHELYPDVPIFASLDMHAIISEEMIKYCNAFVCYKCAPHTDTFETGYKVGLITLGYLNTKKLPKQFGVKIPFLLAGEQSETSTEPMKTLINELKELEMNEDVISASFALGFPWADSENNGCTAIVVSYDEKVAKDNAIKLANKFWALRDNFSFCTDSFDEKGSLDEAIKSLKEGIFPIVISDSGDNPTAGSSQDVVTFLDLILHTDELKALSPPLCYNAIYDPEIVQMAFESGLGSNIKGILGGKFDKTKGQVNFNGVVKALNPDYKGCKIALINIDGIDVIVTAKRVPCYECDMMRSLDVEVEKLKVLVVKLGYLEPELKGIAKKSILALTEGGSDELFSRLKYEKLPHPIYPIDKEEKVIFRYLSQ